MFSIQRHYKHSRQYNMLSTNINKTYRSSRQKHTQRPTNTTVYLCWVEFYTYLFALLQFSIFDFRSAHETLNLSTYLQLSVTGSWYDFSSNEINSKKHHYSRSLESFKNSLKMLKPVFNSNPDTFWISGQFGQNSVQHI